MGSFSIHIRKISALLFLNGGFGASSHCKIPQELDAISSHWIDVQSVIQQLNLDQFIVIAYSMGATTTMHGLCYGDFSKHIAAYLHIDQTPKIPVDDAWHLDFWSTPSGIY